MAYLHRIQIKSVISASAIVDIINSNQWYQQFEM